MCFGPGPKLGPRNFRSKSEVGDVKPKVPRPGIRFPSSTSSRYRVTRTRRVTCVTCVRAMRATSRARQINRAGPVRRSGNQAEAKAIWADFPSPTAPSFSRLASYFLHVFCTRLLEY